MCGSSQTFLTSDASAKPHFDMEPVDNAARKNRDLGNRNEAALQRCQTSTTACSIYDTRPHSAPAKHHGRRLKWKEGKRERERGLRKLGRADHHSLFTRATYTLTSNGGSKPRQIGWIWDSILSTLCSLVSRAACGIRTNADRVLHLDRLSEACNATPSNESHNSIV